MPKTFSHEEVVNAVDAAIEALGRKADIYPWQKIYIAREMFAALGLEPSGELPGNEEAQV